LGEIRIKNMQNATLKRIHLMEQKIKDSLNNEDFVAVSSLSREFDKLIVEFTNLVKSEQVYNKYAVELDRLLNSLYGYEKQTSEIFKNYRSRVSIQTKMHETYKKYSS
tara:strand:- start:216 stop:539 length:324 start_codon:yes stop_codon:yes gene_type:complete